MASLNQLISEIAHSIGQSENVAIRRALRSEILQLRSTLIRQSYKEHRFSDELLKQKFIITLIDVPDGDIYGINVNQNSIIKRSKNKVPKPIRLDNNLPFHSVKTNGVNKPIIIPFIRQGVSSYYTALPGMCRHIGYYYDNGYIYIDITKTDLLNEVDKITVEGIFEEPQLVEEETHDYKKDPDNYDDDDEFLLSLDMVYHIKKMIRETFSPEVIRDDNNTPKQNLVK